MISVIIVSYNEADYILSIINYLKNQDFSEAYEIILADGGSTDATISLAREEGIEIIRSKKGKANQMNKAAKLAKGKVLFFVHADMELMPNTLSAVKDKIDNGYDAGGFSNVFKNHNEKIKTLGNWMNLRFLDKREQSDKGLFYGDNGIFVKKTAFDYLGGFKVIPIMEDYEFSLSLKRHNFKTIKIKEPTITVSARRHVKAGFLKTRFQWVVIRKMYCWGIIEPKKLATWYGDVR